MSRKHKILISSYACAPNRGSEPGMGWNFVTGLSKLNEVHVIVEKRKWEKPINEYLTKYPELNYNIKFYFIDKKRNKLLRKIWPPSYYWFYKKWQKEVFEFALKLNYKENFDIIHQLNMVGYREPGYLWKIDKPFVWGPIGGLENSPWSFLPSLGLKGFIFHAARNIVNLWQRNFLIRPLLATKRINSVLITATPENNKIAKLNWGKSSSIICEVGSESLPDIQINSRLDEESLKIVWSGLHIARKNLPLLLRALSKVDFNFELHILGDGELNKKWKNIARELGIGEKCIWYGWVEKNKANSIYCSSHVFCITSISDLTSTVTLESLSFGLPIICLDHCGFSHIVNNSCGIKIPVLNPNIAINEFSKALTKVYHDENLRIKMSQSAFRRSKEFTWDIKINKINKIYNDLLSD